MAKVSIIVPVYNCEKYIAECLDSILNQNFTDIELICVDDGSTDSSLSIIKNYAEADSRIKIISHKENSGLSAARNTGIANATGEYIWFIDSDDYIQSGSIELLYKTIEEKKLDILLPSAVRFESDPEAKNVYTTSYERKKFLNMVISGKELLNIQTASNSFFSSACCLFIRREFLVSTGVKFFEGIIHEDELFTVLIMNKAEKAMCIPDVVYNRRMRNDSIMTKRYTYKNFEGYFVAFVNLLAEYIKDGESASGVLSRMITTFNNSNYRYNQISDEERKKIAVNLPEVYKFLYEKLNYREQRLKNANIENTRKIKQLEDSKAYYEKQFKISSDEIVKIKKQNTELLGIIDKKEDNNKELHTHISELDVTNKKVIEELALLHNLLKNNEEKNDRLQDTLNKKYDEINKLNGDIAQHKANEAQTAVMLENSAQEIAKLNSDIEQRKAKEAQTAVMLENSAQEITKLNSDIEQRKAKEAQTAVMLENSAQEIARLNGNIEQCKANEEQTAVMLENSAQEINRLKDEVAKYISKLTENDMLLKASKEREETLKSELQQTAKKLEQKNKIYTDVINSVSFRLGRILTWLPRKIKSFLKGK